MWGITRKGRIIQQRILDYVKRNNYPVSSRHLCLALGYSWNTVQNYCLELQLKNKIHRLETSGCHLWISLDFGKKLSAQQKTKTPAVTFSHPAPTSYASLEIDKDRLIREIEQEWNHVFRQEVEKYVREELLKQSSENTVKILQENRDIRNIKKLRCLSKKETEENAQENRTTAQFADGGPK